MLFLQKDSVSVPYSFGSNFLVDSDLSSLFALEGPPYLLLSGNFNWLDKNSSFILYLKIKINLIFICKYDVISIVGLIAF